MSKIENKSKKLSSDIKKSHKEIKSLQKDRDNLQQVLNFKDAININLIPDLSKYKIDENPSLKEECTVMTQLTDIHLEEEVKLDLQMG